MINDSIKSKGLHNPGLERSVFTIIKPHLTLAAAMIALVIISYTGLKLILPEDEPSNKIENNEIVDYLSIEADEDMIINELHKSKSAQQTAEGSSEDIINYLLNNDIDESEIVECL